LNAYLYANSNPLRYVDPSGEFPWIIIPPVVIGGYAIAAVLTFKDCMERCTDTELPRDTDCDAPENWEKCSQLCIRYAFALGFGIEPVGPSVEAFFDYK
jgi:hypothetical protein